MLKKCPTDGSCPAVMWAPDSADVAELKKLVQSWGLSEDEACELSKGMLRISQMLWSDSLGCFAQWEGVAEAREAYAKGFECTYSAESDGFEGLDESACSYAFPAEEEEEGEAD